MRLRIPPGVHRPRSDTWLLAQALHATDLAGATVADLCTGSGALAVAAAQARAARVVATDTSWRAVLAARVNAALNRCAVEVRRGDLLGALGDDRFDLLVSNPPYVPASTDALPQHRSSTPLDGGRNGRALLDRLCSEARDHLRPGGSLLLVQSSVCGERETCGLLEAHGMSAEVHARRRGPLGPVLRSRAPMLRARGLLGDADEEDLLVIRGRLAA